MWVKQVYKYIRMPLAVIIILAALITSLFRSLTPLAIQYKTELEQHLSQKLGMTVTIQRMETGWYWFYPVVQLHKVSVVYDESHPFIIQKALVGINLLESLRLWHLQPGLLYVDGVNFTLQQQGTHWGIQGLIQKNTPAFNKQNVAAQAAWLLSQNRLVLKNIKTKVIFNDGATLNIQDLDFKAAQRAHQYRLKGRATVHAGTSTALEWYAKLYLDPADLASSKGQAYITVKDLALAPWLSHLPTMPLKAVQGDASFEWWLDWDKGQLTHSQAVVDAKHVRWNNPSTSKPDLMQALHANVLMSRSKGGWTLSADNVGLRLNGVVWPKNELSIQHINKNQSTDIYVKHVLVSSLLSTHKNWPEELKPWIAAHPEGRLTDLQCHLNKNKPSFLLMQFSRLRWQATQELPGVDHLSGVVYWEPNEGRLELDSDQTKLHFPKQKKLPPMAINGALEWKQLSHGLRISIERFVLQHPELLITLQGFYDKAQDNLASQVDLKAKFSVKNMEKWIRYLPAFEGKVKLQRWLHKDIKKIDSFVAELNLSGNPRDFPFDKDEGVFTLNGYIHGMDLKFSPKWPLTKDIDTWLTVNKRQLNADLVHADLQGMMVDKANIRIADLGLDKETMLVHAVANADSSLVMPYISASPLNKKLSGLTSLGLEGMMGLDLQLEIPLYPENDDDLALGRISFDDETITVSQLAKPLVFEKIKGFIEFDQDDILDTNLIASLWGRPVTIAIRSLPKALTEVTLLGKFTVQSLQKGLDLVLKPWLSGSLNVAAKLQISSKKTDFDHLFISSDTVGLAMDLPKPFKKSAKDSMPLELDWAFDGEGHITLKAHYGLIQIARSINNLWSFKTKQPDIAGIIRYNPQEQQLKAHLTKLNIVPSKTKQKEASLHFKGWPNMEMTINALTYNHYPLGELFFKTMVRKNDLVIDNGRLRTPFYDVQFKGDWYQTAKREDSHLSASLTVKDLGKSLTAFKVPSVIESGHGTARFTGLWKGSFADFRLDKIKGELGLVLRNGRITQLSKEAEEKLGLGKLLSILSLQTIPRRLTLDFSDLSNSGFSFDTFQGNFAIKKGMMRTTNSYIDGPIAYASMQGSIDVAKQLYDLELKISPHVTASLPIVATIAGGPVAGIATWVVGKLINQGMQNVSGYSYKITGPWLHPLVQQVSIVKSKPKAPPLQEPN